MAADVVSASAVKAPGQMYTDSYQMVDHNTPRALETDEITRIAHDYANAAANAITASFDGVEFHSANGYLPQQFLSTNVNQSTDKYGGSIANRIRMPLEALAAIIDKIGADRVGIRLIEHQCHDEFHPQGQAWGNLKLERDYKDARQQKRNCMAQPPKSSHERGAS